MLVRRHEGFLDVGETRLEAVYKFDGAALLRRARLGVTAIFFANGLGIGAWAVAIPQVKALFSLSDGGLSLILLAAGVGAIAAMPVAGLLPPRMGGTGRTLRISAPLSAVMLAALPAMNAMPAPAAALAACAFLFGFSNILVDVPMNAHASVIERAWERAIMSSFHAAWSAGGLIGSTIGGFLISARASPLIQLGVGAALCFLLAATGSLSIGVGALSTNAGASSVIAPTLQSGQATPASLRPAPPTRDSAAARPRLSVVERRATETFSADH